MAIKVDFILVDPREDLGLLVDRNPPLFFSNVMLKWQERQASFKLNAAYPRCAKLIRNPCSRNGSVLRRLLACLGLCSRLLATLIITEITEYYVLGFRFQTVQYLPGMRSKHRGQETKLRADTSNVKTMIYILQYENASTGDIKVDRLPPVHHS